MTSLKVAVRVRPLSERESYYGSNVVVDVLGRDIIVKDMKVPENYRYDHRVRIHRFTFDYGFWSVDPTSQRCASQKTVYEEFGLVVLNTLLEGYNSCVIAYGPSGSGKTYTMMGTKEETGLTPRICEGLFTKLTDQRDNKVPFQIDISYMEVYNEQVYDLLHFDEKVTMRKPKLRIREHPIDGPFVEGLSTHIVKNIDDVCYLLARGNENRKKADTHIHDRSSRSHAIFTIRCSQACLNETEPRGVVSKLHLVDLAGSEKASPEFCQSRVKEGGNINKSLVTLGNVISVLVELSLRLKNGESQHKQTYVPYRDSHLTWLLKDSLGGNSHTFMLAAISPSKECYIETVSTLRYAQRAKFVLNRPIINEDPATEMIRNLKTELCRLKSTIWTTTQGLPKPFVMQPLADVLHIRSIMEESARKVDTLTRHWFDRWMKTYDVVLNKVLNSDDNSIEVTDKGRRKKKESYVLELERANKEVTSLLNNILKHQTHLEQNDVQDSSECIILDGDSVGFSNKKHVQNLPMNKPVCLFPSETKLSKLSDDDNNSRTTRVNSQASTEQGNQKSHKLNKFLSNSDDILHKCPWTSSFPLCRFSSFPETILRYPYRSLSWLPQNKRQSCSSCEIQDSSATVSEFKSVDTAAFNSHIPDHSLQNEIVCFKDCMSTFAGAERSGKDSSMPQSPGWDEWQQTSEVTISNKISDHSDAVADSEEVRVPIKLTTTLSNDNRINLNSNENVNQHCTDKTAICSSIGSSKQNATLINLDDGTLFEIVEKGEFSNDFCLVQNNEELLNDNKELQAESANEELLLPSTCNSQTHYSTCPEIMFTDQVIKESNNIVKYLQINAPESIESCSGCCSPKRKDSEIMSLLSFSSFDGPFFRSMEDLSSNEEGSNRYDVSQQDNMVENSNVRSLNNMPSHDTADVIKHSKFHSKQSDIKDFMPMKDTLLDTEGMEHVGFSNNIRITKQRNECLEYTKNTESNEITNEAAFESNHYCEAIPVYLDNHQPIRNDDLTACNNSSSNYNTTDRFTCQDSKSENMPLKQNFPPEGFERDNLTTVLNEKSLCYQGSSNAFPSKLHHNKSYQLTKENLDLLAESQEQSKENAELLSYMNSCMPYVRVMNDNKTQEIRSGFSDLLNNKNLQPFSDGRETCKGQVGNFYDLSLCDRNENVRVSKEHEENKEFRLDANFFDQFSSSEILLPIPEEISNDANEKESTSDIKDITVDSLDNLEEEMEHWANKYLKNNSLDTDSEIRNRTEGQANQLHLNEFEFSTKHGDFDRGTQQETVLDQLQAILKSKAISSLGSSLSSSSDSITYVFVNKDEHEKPFKTTNSNYSSMLSSVSLDSLDKTVAAQPKVCFSSPRTLSIDSLLAEEMLAQLKNSSLRCTFKGNTSQQVSTNKQLSLVNESCLREKGSTCVINIDDDYEPEPQTSRSKTTILNKEGKSKFFANKKQLDGILQTFQINQTKMQNQRNTAISDLNFESSPVPKSFHLNRLNEQQEMCVSSNTSNEFFAEIKTNDFMKIEETATENKYHSFDNSDSMPAELDSLDQLQETMILAPPNSFAPCPQSTYCDYPINRRNEIPHISFTSESRSISTQTDESSFQSTRNEDSKYHILSATYLDLTMRMMEFMTETMKFLKKESSRNKECCHQHIHRRHSSRAKRKLKFDDVSTSSSIFTDEHQLRDSYRSRRKTSQKKYASPKNGILRSFSGARSKYSTVGVDGDMNSFSSMENGPSNTSYLSTLNKCVGDFRKVSPTGRDSKQCPGNRFHGQFAQGILRDGLISPSGYSPFGHTIPNTTIQREINTKNTNLPISNSSEARTPDPISHLQNLVEIRRRIIQETKKPQSTVQTLNPEENAYPPHLQMVQTSSSEGYLSSISSRGLCKQFSECGSGSYVYDGQDMAKHHPALLSDYRRPKEFHSKRKDQLVSTPKMTWQNTSADSGAFVMDSPLTEKSDFFTDFDKIEESRFENPSTLIHPSDTGKYCEVSCEDTNENGLSCSPIARHKLQQNSDVDIMEHSNLWNGRSSSQRDWKHVSLLGLEGFDEEYPEIERKPSTSFIQKISDANYKLQKDDIERILATIEADKNFLRRRRNFILDRKFYPEITVVPSREDSNELFSYESYRCLPDPALYLSSNASPGLTV